jgi:hypothetical protein
MSRSVRTTIYTFEFDQSKRYTTHFSPCRAVIVQIDYDTIIRTFKMQVKQDIVNESQ